MKRPFVFVVSFYAIGLLPGALFKPPPVVLFAISFLTLALVFAVPRFRPILLCALLALAGWTNLALRTAPISPRDLRGLIGDSSVTAAVRGTLAQTPQIKISQRKGNETEHTTAQVHVAEIRTTGDWEAADGEVIVWTPGLLSTNFFAGQPVEIAGTLARPPPPVAEGLFDDREYLRTRGIFYELRTKSAADWHLGDPALSAPPLTDRFLNWSKQTLAIGLPEDGTLRLLWAMTLGWHTAFTGDVGDPFLRAGTMHMFAIDGLRIALITGIFVSLLRVLRLPRAWCGAISVPAIWFYTAATGWEPSAVRASVMMTIVLGGWSLKRPGDLLNSLAAAAFLILAWDPRQLFEASFQLSFFVMLTIGLLLPKLNDLVDRLLQHDPLLPAELISKPRRVMTQALRWLGRYFSLSLAAWVGSIPLSALYFHLFSTVSPVANIIAVPLGTFALMANLGALICGTWLPWATTLFNDAAWFFMAAMTGVSEWFTEIPCAYFYVAAPSWITVGIFYAVLLIALSGWLKTAAARISFAVALALIAAFYFVRWESARAETDLTVLPLDGGHAVFAQSAGLDNDWLIDCGSQESVNWTVKPFLRAHGINKVPRLALTEGDSKNCGGAFELQKDMGIGELWTSPVHFRSAAYNRIIAMSKKPPLKHKLFISGDDNGAWSALWPAARNHFSRADDNALVLRGHFPGATVLLLSDLSPTGQLGLLSCTNDLRADIVVAGLPTQGQPLCDALADAIQPKLIVIADSDFPPQRRANETLKYRLKERGVPVIYTQESGAVKIVVNKEGWTAQTMDGQRVFGIKN